MMLFLTILICVVDSMKFRPMIRPCPPYPPCPVEKPVIKPMPMITQPIVPIGLFVPKPKDWDKEPVKTIKRV